MSKKTGEVSPGTPITKVGKIKNTLYGVVCDDELGECSVVKLNKHSYIEHQRKKNEPKIWYYIDTLLKVPNYERIRIKTTHVHRNVLHGVIYEAYSEQLVNERTVALLSSGAIALRRESQRSTLRWYYLSDNTEVPKVIIDKIQPNKDNKGIYFGVLENSIGVGLFSDEEIEKRKAPDKPWHFMARKTARVSNPRIVEDKEKMPRSSPNDSSKSITLEQSLASKRKEGDIKEQANGPVVKKIRFKYFF